MDVPRSEPTGSRFDELHAEVAEAIAYAANSVRTARDRYRHVYLEELGRWQVLSDDLGSLEHAGSGPDADTDADALGTGEAERRTDQDGIATGQEDPTTDPGESGGSRLMDNLAASAAEAGAADLRLRMIRGDVDRSRGDLAVHEAELSRLELALRNLESTWLFIERGDASLVTEPALPTVATELQMRIVEAQEAERARLAQEVHDGPAQALSNAIFQADFIDRVFESDPRMARSELTFLRELLRRELGDVRSFIVQLRPPVLVELGLNGSLTDTVETQAALSGRQITAELDGPTDGLSEAAQTVVLRIAQEALQNVRKHATATTVLLTTRLDGPDWILEVRDDGRGFDTGAVAARGRRNFGLQFMRERAELIGARFEVESRPEAGTVVRLAIPLTRKENA
jgi:two-component system sensor histidine kinase DegS